jgi:hypothetical protein
MLYGLILLLLIILSLFTSIAVVQHTSYSCGSPIRFYITLIIYFVIIMITLVGGIILLETIKVSRVE